MSIIGMCSTVRAIPRVVDVPGVPHMSMHDSRLAIHLPGGPGTRRGARPIKHEAVCICPNPDSALPGYSPGRIVRWLADSATLCDEGPFTSAISSVPRPTLRAAQGHFRINTAETTAKRLAMAYCPAELSAASAPIATWCMHK